ncbi:MAG: diacylglycerol kinase family lipid kinase [Actinomycetota bacterium]|nr:diacylglycerol kinase family lipid kinase [Actinomycetota bacterium]MDD5668118.1 diacylglycerol kinase family lipid kinase [Actinomycetota bacterium]
MPKDGEDKRYLVIVNPVSRGGKAQEEGIWLLNRLKKAGVDYEFLFTERAGHAEEMVVKWAEDFDVVVSVSGDGTTNEIINGIMKVPSADLRLAMFPAGTADDFACNMGYDRKDKEQALEAILGNTCRTIDLIRYDDHYAAVTWGLGVDSEIADGAYKWKRFRIPAYFYSGLKKCFFEERKKYDVRFDYEGQIFEGKVLISILCNAPVFGRYIRINPNARMNDGLLDLTVGREMPNVYGLVLFAFACLGGRHGFSKLVSYHQVREMRVECRSDTYAQIDGEVYKFEAGKIINLSVVRGALKVLVPEESVDDKRLPFVYREEPPEPVQLRLIPRREGVAEELEELSRRVKARVEKALETRRMGPAVRRNRVERQGQQQVLFSREWEEKHSARRAAKRMKREMRKLERTERHAK